MTYIAFEGPDGSGKSRAVEELASFLREHSTAEIVTVREPGSTEFGEQLREFIFNTRATPRAIGLLIMATRGELYDTVVRPALDRGAIVISDRCWVSTAAYNSYVPGSYRMTTPEAPDHILANTLAAHELLKLPTPSVVLMKTRYVKHPVNYLDEKGAEYDAWVDRIYSAVERHSSCMVIIKHSSSIQKLGYQMLKYLPALNRKLRYRSSGHTQAN